MRPQLIAECCQNHNGDRNLLKKMIHTAADSGADYVKIQAIRSSELTHRERFDMGAKDAEGNVIVIQRPFEAELERLSRLDLRAEDEAWFAEECRNAGVSPMITAFTRAGVQRVASLGYDAIKIASYDCASLPLLKDAVRHWPRIFVSTGATYDEEIKQAAEVLRKKEFFFLHCVTVYPTPMAKLHLRRMKYLKRFTPRVGYSDHTKPEETGLWASKIALALGARCVERHYTVLDASQTKDGPVSITPVMLAELREFADRPLEERMELIHREYPDWEQALGEAQRPLSQAELLNRDYYRGRFASRIGDGWVQNWEERAVD